MSSSLIALSGGHLARLDRSGPEFAEPPRDLLEALARVRAGLGLPAGGAGGGRQDRARRPRG